MGDVVIKLDLVSDFDIVMRTKVMLTKNFRRKLTVDSRF